MQTVIKMEVPLLSIMDRLKELEKRATATEVEQAEMKAKYKALDIVHTTLRAEYSELKAKYKALDIAYTILRAENSELRVEYSELKAKYKALDIAHTSLKVQMKEMQRDSEPEKMVTAYIMLHNVEDFALQRIAQLMDDENPQSPYRKYINTFNRKFIVSSITREDFKALESSSARNSANRIAHLPLEDEETKLLMS